MASSVQLAAYYMWGFIDLDRETVDLKKLFYITSEAPNDMSLM